MTTTDKPKAVHQGRNVKRFREFQDLKQETLAELLGDGWSQKKVSLVESSEVIDPALIDELAKALKVSPEAIKNLDEDTIRSIFQNNYNSAIGVNYNCTVIQHPVDKIMELHEENKKLYEALLKEKDEKIALLQQLLERK